MIFGYVTLLLCLVILPVLAKCSTSQLLTEQRVCKRQVKSIEYFQKCNEDKKKKKKKDFKDKT